jgi:hypothetical protein
MTLKMSMGTEGIKRVCMAQELSLQCEREKGDRKRTEQVKKKQDKCKWQQGEE